MLVLPEGNGWIDVILTHFGSNDVERYNPLLDNIENDYPLLRYTYHKFDNSIQSVPWAE